MAKCADKTPLDDATAAKVKAAALEAVPGATVDKVGHERGTDGYVALLTKSDGTTRVLVHEDAAFKVTKVEDPAPARGDHDHGDRAPLDDATAAKVKAAALEAVPGATVDKVGHDHESDGYIAVLTKSDGTTRVLVHEDAAFKVTKVEDPAPARGPGDHGRGDGDRDGDHGKNGTTPTTTAAA
jgi:ribosomal protein L2